MSYLSGVLSVLQMNQYHYFFKTFAIPFAENTPLTELTYLAAVAKSLLSCLTLFDPIDGSLPGFPIPGILQARRLEWVSVPLRRLQCVNFVKL